MSLRNALRAQGNKSGGSPSHTDMQGLVIRALPAGQEDTFKLHLEECLWFGECCLRNGFLGGGDSLSQDLAAGKCRALLTMGCGLARNRGTLSVSLATGKWFAEGGWDQMIEDKGHGRRSLEVSS